jgi:hypothetical protein
VKASRARKRGHARRQGTGRLSERAPCMGEEESDEEIVYMLVGMVQNVLLGGFNTSATVPKG